MTIRLCVGPRCRDYGQHSAETCREGCIGCAPRPAVVGRLCRVCCRNIGINAILAARAHADLEVDLVNVGGGGGGGGSNPFPSVSFDSHTSQARASIHTILASWGGLISDESGSPAPRSGFRLKLVPIAPGVQGPQALVSALHVKHHLLPLPNGVLGPLKQVTVRVPETGIGFLGAYISAHRWWLAGHPLAEHACAELADLVSDGLWQQEKVRAGKVHIGPCPKCGADLTAVIQRTDAGAGSAAVCTGPDRHRWEAYEWSTLRKQMRRAETATAGGQE